MANNTPTGPPTTTTTTTTADTPGPPNHRWHEILPSRFRWALRLEAGTWRQLSNVGFWLHRWAAPVPPPPSFTRTIPITISPRKEGRISLNFWAPENYNSSPSSLSPESPNKKYPVMINFHGGGFTIGTSMDDARWAHACLSYLDCVFVSVEYRLAPEYTFPTAVEDGADACLWLIDHAEELSLDPNRMATTGFSAGGNMAFTVCIRVREEIENRRKARGIVINPISREAYMEGIEAGDIVTEPQTVSSSSIDQVATCPTLEDKEIHEGRIVAIASFYPSADYTISRDTRRLSILRKDKGLPAIFTDLFDCSYLHPPQYISLDDKYLSPGIAPTEILRNSLPEDIILYTCEWDELLVEGERFAARLGSDDIGKRVRYRCIMNARHGWDKSPFSWKGQDERRDGVYREVCNELGKVFYGPEWKDLGTADITCDTHGISTQCG